MHRDIQHSIRLLVKDWGYSTTVLLTLAVCIGANAAVFTIVNSILLRPLPVPGASEIVLMSNRYPKAGAVDSNNSGAADYYDRRRDITVLSDQAMFNYPDRTVEINGTPQQIAGMSVTPTFFPLIRTTPQLGRAFTDAEGEIGNERKIILSHSLWMQLFGGDPSAIGRQLQVSGRPHEIIGVMAPGFLFAKSEVQFWIPLAFTKEQKEGRHSNSWFHIGRLRPGATIEQVQAQIDALNASNMERFPQWREVLTNAGFHTKVERYQDNLTRGIRSSLYLLWGGAFFVLLIGIVNLANLTLARLKVRMKEFATRLALGATRLAVIRQLVTENLLLALAGGLAGLGLSYAILGALANLGLDRLPRSTEIHMDAAVVLFALAMASVVGILLGMLPAASIFQVSLNGVLREEGRSGTSSRASRRIRQALVVAQLAFAFVLLMGAGLLLASFRQLLTADPGYKGEGVMTATVSLPRARYAEDKDIRAFTERALAAIRRNSGVTAGLTSTIPLGGDHNDSVILAEGYEMKPGESVISPMQSSISPGYFEAMGIPLSSGRYFSDRDTDTSKPVVIVDEKLARKFWPQGDAVGHRMYAPSNPNDLLKTGPDTRWLEVVGVVKNVRMEDLAGKGTPVGAYYYPQSQSARRDFTFALKGPSNMESAAAILRQALREVDPQLALYEMNTMREREALSLAPQRSSMVLSLAFGAVALFLSALGIYGVLAYLVAQRRREIGIRMALGSTEMGVFQLILSEGLGLVIAGLLCGLAGSAVLQRAVQTQIYGVQPFEPSIVVMVSLALGLVALAAIALPARRAMTLDPVAALGGS